MEKDKAKALVTLGQNIKAHRESLVISQEELAFRAGLDRTYLGGAERGERNLTVLSALKICEALGVTLSSLVEGVTNAD